MTRRAAYLIVGSLLAGAVAFSAHSTHAQRAPGALGLGGQIGSPSGITVKIYNPNTISYDFLAAWDLGDFFFLNVHGLYERPFEEVENVDGVEYFFGPGAYIGFQDDGGPPGRDDGETVLGISGRLGINVPFEDRFEFFVQITPRINLVPDTEGDFGGGVGLRYYFGS